MRTIYYHSSEKKALYRLTGQFFKAGSPRSIQQQMQAERKRANRLVPGHAAVRRHTIDLAVRAALNLQIINPQSVEVLKKERLKYC